MEFRIFFCKLSGCAWEARTPWVNPLVPATVWQCGTRSFSRPRASPSFWGGEVPPQQLARSQRKETFSGPPKDFVDSMGGWGTPWCPARCFGNPWRCWERPFTRAAGLCQVLRPSALEAKVDRSFESSKHSLGMSIYRNYRIIDGIASIGRRWAQIEFTQFEAFSSYAGAERISYKRVKFIRTFMRADEEWEETP